MKKQGTVDYKIKSHPKKSLPLLRWNSKKFLGLSWSTPLR
jgi:hypothetical protein